MATGQSRARMRAIWRSCWQPSGDARRQANWVVVTSHTHQGGGNQFIPGQAGDKPGCMGLYEDACDESRYVPADALVTFARAAIDAGADAFYGHGPHVLRGIEIYQGKPIFYSLDDFLFQNETPPFQPWDNYAQYDVDAFRGLPSDFYDGREAASGGGAPRRGLLVGRSRGVDGVPGRRAVQHPAGAHRPGLWTAAPAARPAGGGLRRKTRSGF